MSRRFDEWKALARDAIVGALWRAGATDPSRLAGRLSIATFHRVLPDAVRREYPYPGLVVTPDELDWFLGFFERHFTLGTLHDSAARWRSGEGQERPPLALTFDDGQLDNYVYARPVLAKRRLQATFFVPYDAVARNEPIWHDRLGWAVFALLAREPERAHELLAGLGFVPPDGSENATDMVLSIAGYAKLLPNDERRSFVDRVESAASAAAARPSWDGLMSFRELRVLGSEGHEIGSHSLSHPILPKCSDSEIEDEVIGSRARLEEALGLPIESFCYPNGDHDARSEAAVARAGYRYAVTTRAGSNVPDAEPYLLRRCDIQPAHARDRRGALSAARLAWRLSVLHSRA